jgi:hypothetical protein
LKGHDLNPDGVGSPASAYRPVFPQMKSITWLIGPTSTTIALDNIYRAQSWLKHCTRQLVSAANVFNPILFPVRRCEAGAGQSKHRWSLTPVAEVYGRLRLRTATIAEN